MFDIGWQELLLIAVVALVVIGPKDLPKVLKTVMAGMGKLRHMAQEFRSGIDEVIREAEIDVLFNEGISRAGEVLDFGSEREVIKKA